MDLPRHNNSPRQGSDGSERQDERRAAVSQMMAENREGLGMKVIAVMVQRYGVLPKEMWDLNSISDMGAGRSLSYVYHVSKSMFKEIISNTRYSIVDLTLWDSRFGGLLPGALKRLNVLTQCSSLKHPLDLPENLQELTFGDDCIYGHPLVLPDSLRKLKLSHSYNLPMTLPSQLVELELGQDYCQRLHLPHCLKRLVFAPESRFNLPVDLPDSLVSIWFGDSYNQPTILPPGIEEIRVGRTFAHDLSLPPSVRRVEWCCTHPVQLPDGVVEVEFDGRFNQPVVFPESLKRITFHEHHELFGNHIYSHPLTFPIAVEELTWWRSAEGVVLPEGLRKLSWSSTSGARLPLGLKELVLQQAAPLDLPDGLLKITFGISCGGHYNLPESVQEVEYRGYATFTHPSTLQHLTWENGEIFGIALVGI